VDVAYPQLSDWTHLQLALRRLIFGIQHSDFLEVRTKIKIHNNGLLGKGKIDIFYLDIGRIIRNFHFFIGNFGGSYLQSGKGQISLCVGGGKSDS